MYRLALQRSFVLGHKSAIKPDHAIKVLGCIISKRNAPSDIVMDNPDYVEDLSHAEDKTIPVLDLTERWKEANKLFYGPERDLVNFPPPRMNDSTPSVRFGLFPDRWFTPLEKKTGVSGPLVAFGVITIACFGKNLLGYGSVSLKAAFLLMWIGFIFPRAKLFLRKAGMFMSIKGYVKAQNTRCRAAVMGNLDSKVAEIPNIIDDIDMKIARSEAVKYIFEAQKENVALELELQYRERLNSVYIEVVRRLEYQKALQDTREEFEQQHMAKWIINSVQKSITPKVEQDALTSSLAVLKQKAKEVMGQTN